MTRTGVRPQKANNRSIFVWLTFGLSAFIHLALFFWLLGPAQRTASRPRLPPISIELRAPPPTPAPAPPAAPPTAIARHTAAANSVATTADRPVSSGVAVSANASATPIAGVPPGPRAYHVPTLGEMAQLMAAQAATQPVISHDQAVADRFQKDFVAAAKTFKAQQMGRYGARSTLVDMSHLFRESFNVTAVTGAAAMDKLSVLGADVANTIAASVKPLAADHLDNDLTPAARESYQRTWQDDLFKVCMGDCGKKHVVARHMAIVRVEHDEDGQPRSWRFRVTTGVPLLDQHIAEVVERAARQRLTRMAGEPIPEWSEWGFSQTVYRWSRSERMLDPLFRPPGMVISELSDTLGDTSAVAQTELLAVTYRKSASEPSAGTH